MLAELFFPLQLWQRDCVGSEVSCGFDCFSSLSSYQVSRKRLQLLLSHRQPTDFLTRTAGGRTVMKRWEERKSENHSLHFSSSVKHAHSCEPHGRKGNLHNTNSRLNDTPQTPAWASGRRVSHMTGRTHVVQGSVSVSRLSAL